MKIAVLKGGCSSESEVSLKTAEAVEASLLRLGHNITSYQWDERSIIEHYEQLKKCDLVFVAYHGSYGEDGHIQAVLELMGIPFTGSSFRASLLAMDKIASKRIFTSLGLRVPKALFWEKREDVELGLIDEMIDIELGGYPVIVKPADSGSTIGLSYVENSSELEQAIQSARKESGRLVIEKYIPGRELTVSILADGSGTSIKPLPIVEIKPTDLLYDYTCKYTKGKSQYICPATIPSDVAERIKQDALTAFRGLGCEGYGRVDLMYDGAEAYYLEVNSLPGMTELSLVPMAAKANGIDFDELIDIIVKEGLKKPAK